AAKTGVASGAKITAPTPTKDGFDLEGWYKDADFEDAWDFATDTVTANTILYAQWDDIRTELTVGEGNDAVAAEATDTTADVEFAFDGTEITGLTVADFVVSEGAEIENDEAIVVESGKVTVTISFNANEGSDAIEYTVSINPDSTLIKGEAEVTVTQAAE
ncbi:MAG: InlB B-repeat-containing protein, partial [Treponema sp.]|nr:InlB B-repeat-containing protein [Treponema sp.]